MRSSPSKEITSKRIPIYRIAELSTVWLMLRLFPEDAGVFALGNAWKRWFNPCRARRCSGESPSLTRPSIKRLAPWEYASSY